MDEEESDDDEKEDLKVYPLRVKSAYNYFVSEYSKTLTDF